MKGWGMMTEVTYGTWKSHGKAATLRFYGRTLGEPTTGFDLVTVTQEPGVIVITNLTDGHAIRVGNAAKFYASPVPLIIKADSTVTCVDCGADDHELGSCTEVTPVPFGYGASVARVVVREGGYTIKEASDLVIRYAELVEKGDRFGSFPSYVAWQIMDADTKAKAELGTTKPWDDELINGTEAVLSILADLTDSDLCDAGLCDRDTCPGRQKIIP